MFHQFLIHFAYNFVTIRTYSGQRSMFHQFQILFAYNLVTNKASWPRGLWLRQAPSLVRIMKKIDFRALLRHFMLSQNTLKSYHKMQINREWVMLALWPKICNLQLCRLEMAPLLNKYYWKGLFWVGIKWLKSAATLYVS